MGLMLGKVDGETMIIMDSFALPVEGTETRVNAQAAAYEYMAAYIENAKQVLWLCMAQILFKIIKKIIKNKQSFSIYKHTAIPCVFKMHCLYFSLDKYWLFSSVYMHFLCEFI